MEKVILAVGDAAEAMDTLFRLYRIQEDGYRLDADIAFRNAEPDDNVGTILGGGRARLHPPGRACCRPGPALPGPEWKANV